MNDKPIDKPLWLALGLCLAIGFGTSLFVILNRDTAWDGRDGLVLLSSPFAVGIICGLLIRPANRNLKVTALGTLVALVAAAPLLREGAICILIVLPLFMPVACATGAIVAALARHYHPRALSPLFGVPLAMLGWGIHHPPAPTLATLEDSVEVTATPEQVYASIEHLDLADFDVPVWARWVGLPIPERIEGLGARVGDVRFVHFGNGVLRADIVEAHPPESFRFKLTIAQSGHEFIDHWCALDESTFEFHASSDGHTRVVHRTTYRPYVYPRAYFSIAERFFGHSMQSTLLRSWAARFEAPMPSAVAAR